MTDAAAPSTAVVAQSSGDCGERVIDSSRLFAGREALDEGSSALEVGDATSPLAALDVALVSSRLTPS